MEQWKIDIINSRIEAVKRMRFAAEVDFRVAVRVDDKQAQEGIKNVMKHNEMMLIALEEELDERPKIAVAQPVEFKEKPNG